MDARFDARFHSVAGRLEAELGRPLPGPAAQALMAPRPRREWPAGFDPADARHAAGLVLAFPTRSSSGISPHASVLLTVRASALERHGGQVSLPGGVVDEGESFEEAALREAQEEVGLDPGAVQLVGPLTPIDIHVSGFRLHPLVGLCRKRPRLSPADGEVSRLLELPVTTLVDPNTTVWRQMTRGDRTYNVPGFLVEDGHYIWGATAMVLAEFLNLLGWLGPANERPSR